MSKILKTFLAVAVATLGFGVMATGASANIVGPGGNGMMWSTSTAMGTGHVFTATNPNPPHGTATVECDTAAFHNIHGDDHTTATFEPDYTGCSVTVGGIKCDASVQIGDPPPAGNWTVTQGAEIFPPGNQWSGTADVNMGGEATISIIASDCGFPPGYCVIHVPAQSGLSGNVVATNNPDGVSINLTGVVSSIKWWSNTPGCGIGTPAESNPAATATYDINSGGNGIDIGDSTAPVQLNNTGV